MSIKARHGAGLGAVCAARAQFALTTREWCAVYHRIWKNGNEAITASLHAAAARRSNDSWRAFDARQTPPSAGACRGSTSPCASRCGASSSGLPSTVAAHGAPAPSSRRRRHPCAASVSRTAFLRFGEARERHALCTRRRGQACSRPAAEHAVRAHRRSGGDWAARCAPRHSPARRCACAQSCHPARPTRRAPAPACRPRCAPTRAARAAVRAVDARLRAARSRGASAYNRSHCTNLFLISS